MGGGGPFDVAFFDTVGKRSIISGGYCVTTGGSNLCLQTEYTF